MSTYYTYGIPRFFPINFRTIPDSKRGVNAERYLDRALRELFLDERPRRPWEEETDILPRLVHASVAFILPLDAIADAEDLTEALLPAPALARLNEIRHPERRRQSCAARIVVAALLARLQSLYPDLTFDYAEEPPYGPKIRYALKNESELQSDSDASSKTPCEHVLYCTLTHTKGAAAVVVSRTPAGIDIEADRPVERLQRVATQAFGEAVGRDVVENLAETGSQDLFFALWGLSESVIKMNRGAPSDDEYAKLSFERRLSPNSAGTDVTVTVVTRAPEAPETTEATGETEVTEATDSTEAADEELRQHPANFVVIRRPGVGILRATIVSEDEKAPVVLEADAQLLRQMFGFVKRKDPSAGSDCEAFDGSKPRPASDIAFDIGADTEDR